jgi:hypothetical protein
MTQKIAVLKFVDFDKFCLTFHLEEIVCSSRSEMGMCGLDLSGSG